MAFNGKRIRDLHGEVVLNELLRSYQRLREPLKKVALCMTKQSIQIQRRQRLIFESSTAIWKRLFFPCGGKGWLLHR